MRWNASSIRRRLSGGRRCSWGSLENLRGIVAQVLLRKTGGGRVAAREVLLNTSAVANLIADGKTSQLPMAIESGRKHGMVALNDALVAFVRGGIVESREAYRRAADQPRISGAAQAAGHRYVVCREAGLTFDEGTELFQQCLQHIFFRQLVDRCATFHRPLVLQHPAPAGLIDAQDDERLCLGRVERELDEIFGGLGRSQTEVRRSV